MVPKINIQEQYQGKNTGILYFFFNSDTWAISLLGYSYDENADRTGCVDITVETEFNEAFELQGDNPVYEETLGVSFISGIYSMEFNLNFSTTYDEETMISEPDVSINYIEESIKQYCIVLLP